MTTASGHTEAILASKVKGTAVYNTDGDKLGEVEDIVLDKLSNNIMYAVLGFGGVLGVGEKYHPVPWSTLDYDTDKDGYVVECDKDTLENAPSYELDEVTRGDGLNSQIRADVYDYYKVPYYW